MRTSRASPRWPARRVSFARGMTRTSSSTPVGVCRIKDLTRAGIRPLRGESLNAPRFVQVGCLGVARAMEQDLLVALAVVLFANELEGVTQGLNRRLDRGLDVAAGELQAVDLALHVLEPRLRFVEEQL